MTAITRRDSYLETMQGQLFRWDLKALVGSVLLGVLMTVVQAVTERVDTALTGGSFVIFGAIGFYTIAALATLFFRLPGGIIAGEVSALIGVATATSPMAPWFIPTDFVFPVVYALVIWKLSMRSWSQHLLANAVGIWSSMLIILWGLLVTIQLPLGIALTSYLVTSIAATVGATILSYLLANAVDRSGALR